jgi:GDP-4-dehydro-6-deoxy-D-mannose reductase
MRALVTGASGFVGRHLCDHLAALDDDVVGTDRAPHDESVVLDILDPEGAASVLADVKPEVVYHLAGWADVGASWTHPQEALRANAEGTMNVLAACRAAEVQRVLVVSSADVYGIVAEDDLPITEAHPLQPVSPYAASKAAADFLAVQATCGYGQEVVRVRAFNHLGPGQGEGFVASAIASRIARNELDGGDEVPVGNLAARRDFTDVRDVVRAYRLLVEQGTPGDVYNVCSGKAVAVQRLADRLLALAERPMRLVIDQDRYRPVDVPAVVGDSSRLRAATGWEPEIPLERTLADLLGYWRERVAHH